MQSRQIVPADQLLPNKLFIIPLVGKPIFPGIFTPMMIISNEDIATIEQIMATNNLIGLVMVSTDDVDNTKGEDLARTGTVAKIIKKINLPDGGINIFISTVKRFRIKKILSSTNPISAAVEYLDDRQDDTVEVKALTRYLITEMKQLSENNPLFF